MMAPAVTGTPIPPGARDLADAGAQLQALGLGRGAGTSSAPGFDWSTAGVMGAEGAAAKNMESNWQPTAAMAGGPAFDASAPKVAPAGFNPAAVNFTPATASGGASSDADLAARRRAAFLDPNVDSLEGMRRARLVMADEIAARGGDLQKFAADSGQMRPMSMKQLEGYMAQLQGGQSAAPAGKGVQVAFNPSGEAPAIDPQVAFAAKVGGDGSAPQNFNMAAGVDQVLRDRGAEAYRAAGNGTLAYQTGPQPVSGIGGEPNQTAFAALAAQGINPAAMAPQEMQAMYGATNALALGLGAPKAGATTRLPQLSAEEVEQLRRMGGGPSFVTPPAGFEIYNRV